MELAINIWFIVDIKTELSKYCIIRPYNLSGTDETIKAVLRYLADSDFVTEEKFNFAHNISITTAEGKEINGYLPAENINLHFKQNSGFFAAIAEEELSKIRPVIVDKEGRTGKSRQRLPQNLLYILSMLMENEYGEMKPYTIPENVAWYEKEKARIDKKT